MTDPKMRVPVFWDQLNIATLLACQLDSIFDRVINSDYVVLCTARQAGGYTGKGTMQFFPKSSTNGMGDCLSVLLTVGGVIEPSAQVIGFVELFRDGPIWGGWNPNIGAGFVIEAEDRHCIMNIVSGHASDGHDYELVLDAFPNPRFGSFHP